MRRREFMALLGEVYRSGRVRSNAHGLVSKLPLYHAIDLPSKAASNLASCP